MISKKQVQILREARTSFKPSTHLKENTMTSWYAAGGLKVNMDEKGVLHVIATSPRDIQRLYNIHDQVVQGLPEFKDVEINKVSDYEFTIDFKVEFPETKGEPDPSNPGAFLAIK